ncbi:tetratricopeptide repeat protein [Solimicrobium silvestre]|uniref:TPR repeat n=1 Tax=Solimicrobium silvestre TaxID=2099400 RepID=A0A2S9GZC2_9BURK|nr:tetratricopeptide repeat protein [Solimicrobium silvestre]PRC93053.1 TPR repeat [Solimicrobium silvestre]
MNIKTINSIPELLQHAVKLHQQGELASAKNRYQQILQINPHQFEALHFLGVIAKQTGNPLEAISLISAAINTVTTALNANHASAFCNLGTAFQDCGQTEQALKNYQQAILLKPDYSIAHNNLGNTFKNCGKLEAAIHSYENALHYHPNYPDAYYNCGTTYQLQQQYTKALNCFERAIQLKTNYPAAYFARGVAFQSLYDYESALVSYDQAITLQPDYSEAYLNRGITLNKLQQFQAALDNFELAIHYQKNYAKAHHYRANTLRQLMRIEDAIEAYQCALELGADSQQITFALAALGVGAPPSAPPTTYVKELFDHYAEHFDVHLVDVLKYEMPQIVATAIEKYRMRDQLDSLDLGCGTGLCGSYLRPYSRTLTGVDLSQKMLDKASQLKHYDQLICTEITEFLSEKIDNFDLVCAADVLVYIGDLSGVFSRVHQALRSGGLFCFSVEEAAEEIQGHDFILKATNRYAHTEQYIRHLANLYDFKIHEITQQVARQENQKNSSALVTLLSRA